MKNFTHPLQRVIKVFSLQPQPLTREFWTISLSPNSFEDSHDWLGFQSEDVAAQDFLTIDSEQHIYELQTTQKEGDVQFASVNLPAPSSQLTIQLSDTRNFYARSKYTLFILLGDFGGFNGAIVMLPSFLISFYAPISFSRSLISKTPTRKPLGQNKKNLQQRMARYSSVFANAQSSTGLNP